jgi:hypothetical protein
MRLVNELEQALDLEPLYRNDYEQKIQQIQHRKQMMIDMAKILGYPLFAQQLDQAFEDILSIAKSKNFTNLQNSEFFSQVSGSLSVKHLFKQRIISLSLIVLGKVSALLP